MKDRQADRRSAVRIGTAAAARLVPVAALLWGVLIAVGLLALDDHGAIDRWDDSVERDLASRRTPSWNSITHYVTWCAETITVVILAVIAVVVLRLVLHRWREAWIVALATTGQALMFMTTQFVVERTRPPVPRLDHGIPTSSFPSGHTAAAVALYGGVAVAMWVSNAPRAVRALFTALGVLVPVAVALARMYRGAHHPSDVMASFVYSGTWLAVVTLVVLTLARRSARADRDMRSDPQPVAA